MKHKILENVNEIIIETETLCNANDQSCLLTSLSAQTFSIRVTSSCQDEDNLHISALTEHHTHSVLSCVNLNSVELVTCEDLQNVFCVFIIICY